MLTMESVEGARLERYIRSRWGREDGGIRGLAEKAGLSADTLYGWFEGQDPALSKLGMLAAALGVKRYELVAILDGERPAFDLAALLDPALRAQLVELIAAEIERRRDE